MSLPVPGRVAAALATTCTWGATTMLAPSPCLNGAVATQATPTYPPCPPCGPAVCCVVRSQAQTHVRPAACRQGQPSSALSHLSLPHLFSPPGHAHECASGAVTSSITSAVGCLPPRREHLDASPPILPPPSDSRQPLGERQPLILGKEGLRWPAGAPIPPSPHRCSRG